MGSWLARGTAVIGILALSSGLMMACTQAKKDVTPDEFYRGKTVTWIASSDAGSGTDLQSRLIAPYLSKEIGASVRVENMGTDEGVNWTYNEGPKDGLTITLKSTGALTANDILKAPGVQYEVDKFIYISDVNPTKRIMVLSPKSPYKTLEALQKAKGLKGGGTTAKGSVAISGAVLSEILGLDAKIITGFKGTNELSMRTAQGEVDFYVISDSSAKQAQDDGFAVPFLTPNKQRSEALPNVPTMYDLGAKVSKELEAPLEFILASGQAVVMPPGVPNDRVEFMRKAFEKISSDDNLQKEFEKLTGARSPFTPGKEVQDIVATMKADKELAGRLDTIFEKHKAAQ